MALNIPNTDLPGNSFLKGVDTGSTMFSRLMQPVLEREKQKQQAEQFAQELALRKQAAARAGANSDLQRQIMQQNLLKLQHSNDPQWAMQQLQAKLDYIQNLGKQGGQAGAGGQSMGSQQQPPVNLMDMINQGQGQEMPQGQGAMMPQEEEQQPMNAMGGQEQPQQPEQPGGGQLPGGIDMDEIKRALTYQALGLKPPAQTGLAYTGPARHAIDLSRIKKQFGANSEEYLNARAEYEAAIDAKKDLRDIRARAKAGLKPGETQFFDEQTGLPLGKEIPLTAKERESEEGNILFNELYPVVYKGAAPFSGEGSISRLENAAANYKTDPRARKLFDDFLLSDKAMAATLVNEASTLKSGHTNQTYNRLKASLDAQDIPNIVKKLIKEYQIPASAQLKAAMRYQKLLSEARTKARKGTPATQKLYYSPELQALHQQEMEQGNVASNNKATEKKTINGKTYEKIDGEWYESE